MDKFKVGNLVRVKAKKDILPKFHYALGHITSTPKRPCSPYDVSVQGQIRCFFEDELEKI